MKFQTNGWRENIWHETMPREILYLHISPVIMSSTGNMNNSIIWTQLNLYQQKMKNKWVQKQIVHK